MPAIRDYFEHQGHRTAVSQRALQAHADPWLGWCELRGVGQVVKEVSPYEADIDWHQVTDLDEVLPLLDYLGQATAKVHCVSDAGSDQTLVEFQTEEAILAVVDGREDDFAARPRLVRPRVRRPRARRPPAVRRRVPQRPDPRSAGGLTGVRLIAPLLLAAAGAAILVAVMENAGGDFSGWPEWQAIAVLAAAFLVPAVLSAVVVRRARRDRGDLVGDRLRRRAVRARGRRRLRGARLRAGLAGRTPAG